MSEEITHEETDPQDSAELSSDMGNPPPVQETIKVKSVLEGLVEVGRRGGKLYRTNGKRAEMMKFDLTSHSVWVGNTFIILNGRLRMPVLETATVKVDMTGLAWLTTEERTIDPVSLFRAHYLSRPNGAEKYMHSNFPAKDCDDMTDDEISRGVPRHEARIRLEAWILCAAMDGTLERYVREKKDWSEGDWWWTNSAEYGERRPEEELVIKTEWWARFALPTWTCEYRDDNFWHVDDGERHIALVMPYASEEDRRTIQVAGRLYRQAASLANAAYRMQLRTGRDDLDPLITELNRTLEFVRTGRVRQA